MINSSLRASRSIAFALIPVALLAAVAPWIHVSVLPALALGFVVASLALVGGAAGTTLYARTPNDLVPLGLAGIVCMAAGWSIAHAGHGRVATEVISGLVASAGVLAVGSAVGHAVGGRMADPGHLLAVAFASSAADIWSVHAPEGVSHAIVASTDVSLQRLVTVSAAIAPDRVPQPAIGIGDMIFAALYLSVCRRHDLSRTRMTLAVALGLLLAGASTFALKRAMPALPFIGAMVVLFEPRARAVARHDRFATGLAATLLLIAAVRVAGQF